MSIASDMVRQLARVISTEGISGRYQRATDPHDAPGEVVRFLMKHPGVRDEAIVNAYGVNAQIITLAHSGAFTLAQPVKFDRIVQQPVGDEDPYVFDAVFPREVGGVIVAWTAYVRGKGA